MEKSYLQCRFFRRRRKKRILVCGICPLEHIWLAASLSRLADILYFELKETCRFDEKIAKTVFGFSILDIYFCPFLKS
jgi:hypothetical protein